MSGPPSRCTCWRVESAEGLFYGGARLPAEPRLGLPDECLKLVHELMEVLKDLTVGISWTI